MIKTKATFANRTDKPKIPYAIYVVFACMGRPVKFENNMHLSGRQFRGTKEQCLKFIENRNK